MRVGRGRWRLVLTLLVVMMLSFQRPIHAATLTVQLTGDEGVRLVGAIGRWDKHGEPRHKIDPKAKIDQPELDATAQRAAPGRWVFKDLPPGRYDLVILGNDRLRIEGFEYPPVLEFDPFLPPTATTSEEIRRLVVDDIKKSRHYENKVEPLALGGDEKAVRVLVMLLRDLPTSYTEGAGTLRFEVWQYTWNYGAWVKERRTRVLHRVLAQVSDLRRWTWAWEPKLGAVSVAAEPVTLQYAMPTSEALKQLPGLHPY